MKKNQKNKSIRPPIVVIMGHVDHGKTTLLANLRSTGMPHEPGEITQHISAFQIEHPSITFIDTPGHASFGLMRQRGATGADIAVLIVAADEGPKAQTKEAYKVAQKASIPVIIAINKIDLPKANLPLIKSQLAEFTSGEEITVEISAKNSKGLDDLLEAIKLVASELDLSTVGKLEPVVLERTHDTRIGMGLDLILRKGSLKIGEGLPGFIGKIKRIESPNQEALSEVLPGRPVRLFGLKEREDSKQGSVPSEGDEEPVASLILKAKNEGTLAALSLLATELSATVLATGVGNITEKDLFLADQHTIVGGFGVKVEPSAQKYAEKKGCLIVIDEVIHQLEEALEESLVKLASSQTKKGQKQRVELGEMEIIATFKNLKDGLLAGGPVTEGVVALGAEVDVWRTGEEIGKGRVKELQHKNKAQDQVEQGQEAGIYFEGKQRLKIGDRLKVWRLE